MATPIYAWVTKSVLNRLRSRFLLSDNLTVPDPLLLYKTIMPVTSVDEVLRTNLIGLNAAVGVTATGELIVATVPKGKLWRLFGYYLTPVAGTWTVNTIKLVNVAGSQVLLDLYSPSSASGYKLLPQPVPAEEDWTIVVNVDTKAVNGSFNFSYIYQEEDIF